MYHIRIITNRLEEARGPTARWLKRRELLHDEPHFPFDKTVLFDKAAVAIDGSPQMLERAVANNARGTGVLLPWNKTYARNGFALCRDLNAMLGYVVSERRGDAEKGTSTLKS